MPIEACNLPDGALLARYRDENAFTDCYCVVIPHSITHEQFVTAFYTTTVFKLERFILKWFAKPGTDEDAARLASGKADSFAAWSVEGRSENQLLLRDFQGRTRSWLMVTSMQMRGGNYTRLYFGSAVVPAKNAKTGEHKMAFAFRALLGFHKVYSRVLLSAAKARLSARH